ncbi:MAG: tRNA (guanosine(37)-N1)-methyltransferase TrmD [Oscillospiraceae bacterium]|nr:tRNA (guanosine(37)-N1)-methyltransferase TrmD [Oscillospiraceae bacterium]
MRIDIATLFPELCETWLSASILGRAREAGVFELKCHQIRDYAFDKHQRVDDTPYSERQGMLMMAEPIWQCYKAVAGDRKPYVVFMSPKGKTLTQQKCLELSKKSDLFILCGHYEGVDQRVLDKIVDEEISLGDFVLTGGELPAVVLVDGIARMLEGTLGHETSHSDESHFDGLLEYPQYTRPEVWQGEAVPKVLLSGHRENILKWRRYKQVEETFKKRPELLEKANLSLVDQSNLSEISAILEELPKFLNDKE